VSIVKSKTFDANFTGSPPIWADGTKTHKTALMCIDAVESKYQTLNKCKILFDLVVLQQQHLDCSYIVFGNIPIRLAKFERNFGKRNFYFITQFMSKCNLYLEIEGVHLRMCLPFRLETPTLLNGCFTQGYKFLPFEFNHSNITRNDNLLFLCE
jgi:hypothetical protein